MRARRARRSCKFLLDLILVTIADLGLGMLFQAFMDIWRVAEAARRRMRSSFVM
jgi:hypothetical protein